MEECFVSLFCHGSKSRRLCRSRLALFLFFSFATMGTAFAVSCPSANIPAAPSGYSSQSFTSSGGISVSDTSQTGSSSISVSGIPSAQQVLKVAVTLNCLSAGSGNGLNDFAFMLAPPGSPSRGFDFLDGTCDGASNATVTIADGETQAPQGGAGSCPFTNSSAYLYGPLNVAQDTFSNASTHSPSRRHTTPLLPIRS